jgi:hypothetical protein
MRTEKKIIEFADYVVMIIVLPKNPARAHDDNEPYDFWSDELKELYDRYDKQGVACKSKVLSSTDYFVPPIATESSIEGDTVNGRKRSFRDVAAELEARGHVTVDGKR